MQDEFQSVRINLTIPKGLLDTVDKAALIDYTSRSDIIRVALLQYIRERSDLQPRPKELTPEEKEVLEKHPYIDPSDHAMIELILQNKDIDKD